MKPYIAILIDSFWEAVGNKVLWALLLGWTFILGGLFPFGYVTESSFRLSSFDISNKSRLIEKLARGVKGQGPQDVQAVATLLKPEFVTRLKEVSDKKASDRLNERDLATALNEVIAAKDFYSEDVFPTAKRRQRLEDLTERFAGGLDNTDLEQLNRELLQLVFPLELNQPRGEQLWVGYAGFKIGEPLAVSRRQINQFVEPILLTLIIKLGLGVVAIFVAIVVTSPIIPETFRSSSLHLLLSKPISRVWLFLWKFFGATIFVLVNISFVLIGLYFIAGTRFGIWNNGLLGCIPLLMFVFIIFYSVSALAGLLWGNAIVCVVACMVFWVFCFGVGFVREIMRAPIEVNQQIVRLRPVEDYVFGVNTEGQLNVWNKEYAVWQPAIDSESVGTARTFGPFFDAEDQKLLVKSFVRNPFGDLQARSRKLSIIALSAQPEAAAQTSSMPRDEQSAEPTAADINAESESPEAAADDSQPEPARDDSHETGDDSLPNPFDSTSLQVHDGNVERFVSFSPQEDGTESGTTTDTTTDTQPSDAASDPTKNKEAKAQPKSVAEARKQPRWIPEPGPELPQQLFDVLELNGGLVAVSRNGMYWMDYEKLERLEAVQGGIFGINLPFLTSDAFQDVTPTGFFASDNTTASVIADGSGMVVYSSGTISVLKLGDGKKFELEKSADLVQLGLEGDGTEASLVQMNNRYCVVARDGLPLALLTHELAKKTVINLPQDDKVRHLAWIPGATDSLSIVSHTGRLYKLNCETGELNQVPNSFQGRCTCAYWLDGNRVWLGIEPNQAVLVNATTGEVEESLLPRQTTFQTVYYWMVNPLYLVNPKPAALDNAMSYLLTGNQTVTTQLITNDLGAAQMELQIWQPIVSNLLFVAFILGISCLYVARKEF